MSDLPTQAPFGLLRLDERRRVTEVDASFERIFRSSLGEIGGKQISELASRKDRRGLRQLDRAITSGGTNAKVDVMLTLCFDAGDVLTRLRAVRDPTGWWVWLEDVLAESNNLIQALQLGQAKWSAVHARSDEGIAIIDADDSLLEFNYRFFDLTAFKSSHGIRLNEEALQGQGIFDLLDDEAFDALRAAAVQARTRKRLQFQAVVHHGDLFLDVKLSPIHLRVKGYAGWCLTLRDVTHQELLKQLTEQLQKKNADTTAMLGNLRLGICTIMPGLVIHSEYSRHLEAMLGTDRIADQPLADLVFADANFGADTLHQVCAVIDICLACDVLTFELNEHLLVREFVREKNGVRRVFEADWVPLVGASGGVERLMLTLREVTEVRELQAETREQRRELTVMAQLIRTAPAEYLSSMAGVERMLGEAERLLLEARAGAAADARGDAQHSRALALFRVVHTIKGDARSHGWTQIADAAHHAEDAYGQLRSGRMGWDAERLEEDLVQIRTVIARYVHTWQNTLARSSSASGSLAVSPQWVNEMLALVSESDARVTAARAQLLTLGYPRVETLCRTPYQAVARSAAASGKAVPKLVIDDNDVRSSAALSEPLRQIFDQLMMNALDHGVERDATRRAQGKEVPATFRVVLEVVKHGVRVRFWDDGRGLNVAKLRQAVPDAGDEQLLEMIFESGTSTFGTVSKTSGRGVGLDVVRQLAISHGGSACAEFRDADKGGEQRAIAFVISLPRALFHTPN